MPPTDQEREECEFVKDCPMAPYFWNHGLHCKIDCSLISSLRFLRDWQNELDERRKNCEKN